MGENSFPRPTGQAQRACINPHGDSVMQFTKPIFIRGVAIAFFGLLLLANGGPGCTAKQRKATPVGGQAAAGYTTLTSAQLASMLERKDFYFVNVHIPYEGEIRNTDAFIPFNRIAGNLGTLPDKNGKIILYCRTGRMSQIAARELAQLGYDRVSHLGGGMIAWEQSGYDLLRK